MKRVKFIEDPDIFQTYSANEYDRKLNYNYLPTLLLYKNAYVFKNEYSKLQNIYMELNIYKIEEMTNVHNIRLHTIN